MKNTLFIASVFAIVLSVSVFVSSNTYYANACPDKNTQSASTTIIPNTATANNVNTLFAPSSSTLLPTSQTT
ncbi:MAG: hypothetical protein ACTHKK_00715 [Candidatus Nitrosocosmicus sp.]